MEEMNVTESAENQELNSFETASMPSLRLVMNPDLGSDVDRRQRLRKLGIYTPETLTESVKRDAKKPFVIDGLLRPNSVNFLVGDSGLGKTPLAIQIGVAIAAGLPLFGRAVQQGAVLYCDAESGKPEFSETLQAICRFVGLPKPPEDFNVWSPNWETVLAPHERQWGRPWAAVMERVEAVEALFVVVDAFRTFWPEAETKNQLAAETIGALRKSKGVTWLLLHHRRKVNHERVVGDLVENPQAWFQESAGSLALVNQSDTRIGVEPHSKGEADLLVAGFVRGNGRLVPLDLARVTDDDGTPIGYRLMTGVELLNPGDRAVFDRLPMRFRFRQVEAEMGGKSSSNVARFLKKCDSLQIARKDGTEYVKTRATMESVDSVECRSTAAPFAPSTPLPNDEAAGPVSDSETTEEESNASR